MRFVQVLGGMPAGMGMGAPMGGMPMGGMPMAPPIGIGSDVMAQHPMGGAHPGRVVAMQNDRPILNLTASFHRLEPGVVHQDAMPDAPSPDTLLSDVERRRGHLHLYPEPRRAAMSRPRPIEIWTLGFAAASAIVIALLVIAALWRFRREANPVIKATWLSSRNDAISTTGFALVGLAARVAPVRWPEYLFDLFVAGLAFQATWAIWRSLRARPEQVATG